MNLKQQTLHRTAHRVAHRTAMAAAVAITWLLPTLALARPTEDETATLEARMEGYAQSVRLAEPGSTAFTWILMIILTVIGIVVLFKNANRSHLD